MGNQGRIEAAPKSARNETQGKYIALMLPMDVCITAQRHNGSMEVTCIGGNVHGYTERTAGQSHRL